MSAMSFPSTTPLRPVPGAFLNTPAVASRFQSGSDPVRRQLFPTSSSAQSGGQGGGNLVSGNSIPALVPGGSVRTQESSETLTTVSDSSDSGFVAANPLPAPRVENVPPILKAAKAINSFLQMDESFPDLDSYCRRKKMKCPASDMLVAMMLTTAFLCRGRFLRLRTSRARLTMGSVPQDANVSDSQPSVRSLQRGRAADLDGFVCRD